ncbi:MAG TPA: ATP-binding protein [Chloroflexota bacterium]
MAYEGADLAGVPWPLNSQEIAPLALALIPMIYVLRGLRPAGASLIAVWVVLLAMLDVVVACRGLGRWADDLQVVIIGSVALFVGYRVRQETLLRRWAEESQEALQVSEARYRALFNQSQTAILVMDADRRIREVNAAAAALFEQPYCVPVGRSLDEYFGSEVAGRLLDGRMPPLVGYAVAGGAEVCLRPYCTAIGSGLRQIVLQDVRAEQRRERQRDAYAASVLRVQEEERRRIAQELHDEPMQALISLCRRLDLLPGREDLPAATVNALEQVRSLSAGIATDLRELARGLRPPSLDDLGLVASLRQLLTRVEGRTGIVATLRIRGAGRRLASEVELGLFRIAQEAVQNVERHAQAHRVTVGLVFDEGVRLRVADDGKGFAASTGMHSNGQERLGLLGMQERAVMLGGQLRLRSSPGAGTAIVVVVPEMIKSNPNQTGVFHFC